MWWEPSTERENQVRGAISELKNWFSNQSRGAFPAVWGYGSAWNAANSLVPFVVLNSHYFNNVGPFRLFGLEQIAQSLEGIEFPSVGMPLHVMCVTPPRPSSGVTDLEQQLSLVEAVLDDFVRIREPIVGNPRGAPGTAAVLVWDRTRHCCGLLTAGHLFPSGTAVGLMVDRLRKSFFFRESRQKIGVVSHHVVPNQNVAGWDAAVITLSNPMEPRGKLVRRGVEKFTLPEPVSVRGAVTGPVSEAAVLGNLNEIGYGEEGRLWKNCWLMAPSGVLRSGDSGSAVFTRREQRFLGMYVGSSAFTASGTALFHYIQDAFTLEAEVLSGWNIELFTH
jgi:hypothetical protein